jgi:hypothetical protein
MLNNFHTTKGNEMICDNKTSIAFFLISINIGQGLLKTGGLLLYEDCITSDMTIRFVGKAGLQSPPSSFADLVNITEWSF